MAPTTSPDPRRHASPRTLSRVFFSRGTPIACHGANPLSCHCAHMTSVRLFLRTNWPLHSRKLLHCTISCVLPVAHRIPLINSCSTIVHASTLDCDDRQQMACRPETLPRLLITLSAVWKNRRSFVARLQSSSLHSMSVTFVYFVETAKDTAI